MKQFATKCLGNIVRVSEETDLFAFKPSIPLIFKVSIYQLILKQIYKGNFYLQRRHRPPYL